MKACWLTDIHLNFLEEAQTKEFLETVRDCDADMVFLTGDISESPVLAMHMTMIDQIVAKPVYFVLGNHDFWYTSVAHMQANFPRFLNGRSYLKWLSVLGVVPLDTSTCILGHEGWYDCRYGDPVNSGFMMADWRFMGDYYGCGTKQAIIERSQSLAQVSIDHFRKHLPDAIRRFERIVILTHFPPFDDTHVYNGAIGSPYAQPYFTNRILGELLKAAAQANPTKEFIVFAGHTHGRVSKQVLPNLAVHVGGANYKSPEIQPIALS